MKLVVGRETAQHERRVAIVPDTVTKLAAAGLSVVVERGAGEAAGYPDDAYVAAGAELADRNAMATADVVLAVQPLPIADARTLRAGTLVLSFLQPAAETELVQVFADRKVSAMSLERLPRISRAQSMDALSSQSLVIGYRAAIIAAERLPRFFPLLMTAAGTVPPAKVLVLGAGVAGLQAIATARRLGAVVSAYDVRTAAAEEVKSLGATFVQLDLEALEGAGGYAREMTDERAARQRELLTPFLAASDAVITTAAVPGRKAPLLVDTAMVEAMRPGTVIVDIAAESGGNCELSRPGEEVVHNGVTDLGRPQHGQRHGVRRKPAVRTQPGEPGAADDEGRTWSPRSRRRDRRGLSRRARRCGSRMNNVGLLTIFMLSVFVGFEVISKVSAVLHTPLMSGANAIHGIILVGAILITGSAQGGVQLTLGVVAIVLATANMVGGFVVTDRMLEMFKGRNKAKAAVAAKDADDGPTT